VQEALVEGPQLTAFTVPKLNGTFSDGGVNVGGVLVDNPN
jgi:hypothetical protein